MRNSSSITLDSSSSNLSLVLLVCAYSPLTLIIVAVIRDRSKQLLSIVIAISSMLHPVRDITEGRLQIQTGEHRLHTHHVTCTWEGKTRLRRTLRTLTTHYKQMMGYILCIVLVCIFKTLNRVIVKLHASAGHARGGISRC